MNDPRNSNHFNDGMSTQPPPNKEKCEMKWIEKNEPDLKYACWFCKTHQNIMIREEDHLKPPSSCFNLSKEETNRQWAEELLTVGNEPDEYIPYKQDRETLIRRVADALTQAFERGKKEGMEELMRKLQEADHQDNCDWTAGCLCGHDKTVITVRKLLEGEGK